MSTRVITGPRTRFSYVNLWEPKAMEGGKAKYSASLIISKDDKETLSRIEAAIQQAYEEGIAKLKGTSKTAPPLAAIKTPLRDADVEKPEDEAYKNAFFINANNYSQPGIVDVNRQEIIDHSEIYSGFYGRASISFYAFNVNGNRGIACALNHVMKIADGEPLGSKTTAADDFASCDDADFLN